MYRHPACCSVLFLVLCNSGGMAQETRRPDDIRAAIQQLGAENFDERERAALWLWQAGRAAEPELKQALQSDDLEVRSRAREILNKFRHGLFADTPKEVAGWIRLYIFGNDKDKRDAWDGLRNLETTETTLFKLFDAEPNGELRDWFARDLSVNAPGAVPWLLRQGKFQQAEQLLELGTRFDRYGAELRNYATYLFLRDQLAFKIAQLQLAPVDTKEPDAGIDPNTGKRLLAHLMYANGELISAGAIAQQIGDRGLLFDVHYRSGNWNALIDAGRAPGDNGVEKLGFTATFQRMAGDVDAQERVVAELKKPDEGRSGGPWFSAKALMINDRWQDAVDVLGEQRADQAFGLLCGLSRFREAFELVGMPLPPGDVSRWFADLSARPLGASNSTNAAFSLALQVARTLHRLGEKEHAIRLIEVLDKVAKDDTGYRSLWLSETEFDLQLRERAITHAVQALSTSDREVDFRYFFGDEDPPASVWWQFLCHKNPEEPRMQTFSRLCRLMKRHADRPLETNELRRLVAKAERYSRPLPKQERTGWLQALGETGLMHGEVELARQLFAQHAELDPTADSLIRLGDLDARQLAWPDAVARYRRAAEMEASSALPLYLQGWALEQAGDEVEGRRLMELAVLLPLGNCAQRRELAEGLAKRGLEQAARRQYELICRIGPWHSWEGAEAWAVDDACEQLAGISRETNPLLAAAYWERSLFSCLKTNKSYLHADDYARETHRIHALRARGLFQSGLTDRAVQESDWALAARPTSVELAVEFVPLLEMLQRHANANALFDRVFAANEQVLQNFPRSAEHHHNLASLCLRTGRGLDAGLRHARRAMELDPQNQGYRQTLDRLERR